MRSIKLICAFAILISTVPAKAGQSLETKISYIQVQDNRTWIDVSPSLGDATNCSYKNGVEVANASDTGNPNRELIISIALTAIASGKSVIWLTSDQCSNANRDIVRGIRIVD